MTNPTEQIQLAINLLTSNEASSNRESGLAILRALASPATEPAVPAGWRLVPVEPTEAMLDAACDAADVADFGRAAVHDDIRREYGAMIGAAPNLTPAPLDMVLHCPACGMQHIDTAEHWGGKVEDHKSHLCVPAAGGCGHIWRPADVPTNGVKAAKTKGRDDCAPATPAPAAQGLSDAANMFWNDADPERGHDSIFEVLDAEFGDGVLSIGDTRVIQCAIRLPNITVQVVADPEDEDSFDYEVIVASRTTPKDGA